MKTTISVFVTLFCLLISGNSISAKGFEPFFAFKWGDSVLKVIVNEEGELLEDLQEEQYTLLKISKPVAGMPAEFMYFFTDNALHTVGCEIKVPVSNIVEAESLVKQMESLVIPLFSKSNYLKKRRSPEATAEKGWLSISFYRDDESVANLLFSQHPSYDTMYVSISFFDITNSQSADILQFMEKYANDPEGGWEQGILPE